MTTRIARASAWQVFVALAGAFALGLIAPWLHLIAFLVLMGWYFALGAALHRQAREASRYRLFRANLVFLSLLILGLLLATRAAESTGILPFSEAYELPVALGTLALSSCALFAYFYTLYFVARTLARLECVGSKLRSVTRERITGLMLNLWLWPVGVWFLQPRLRNALVKGGITPPPFPPLPARS